VNDRSRRGHNDQQDGDEGPCSQLTFVHGYLPFLLAADDAASDWDYCGPPR
jgi:hypothetical protein